MLQINEKCKDQTQCKKQKVQSYWHPVGFTALLYLKEALKLERYEDCQSFIDVSREFGAEEWEIQNLLKSYA